VLQRGGSPGLDDNNPERELRYRLIVRLQNIKDFHFQGKKLWRAARYTLRQAEIHRVVRLPFIFNLAALDGTYAAAEAHAGVVNSAYAQIVSKGEVSLAMTAKGNGIDLGVGFSALKIEPGHKGH